MRSTILVLEDNPVVRKMLRAALESEGYAVLEADSGQTALAIASERMPDLAILDLLLPDMHGGEVLSGLRALPGGEAMGAIALSGHAPGLDAARALPSGFTDLLFKPVEPSRLLAVVAGRLSPRRPESLPGRGRRVLVVDDHPVERRLLTLRLEQAGYDVEAVGDGDTALACARPASRRRAQRRPDARRGRLPAVPRAPGAAGPRRTAGRARLRRLRRRGGPPRRPPCRRHRARRQDAGLRRRAGGARHSARGLGARPAAPARRARRPRARRAAHAPGRAPGRGQHQPRAPGGGPGGPALGPRRARRRLLGDHRPPRRPGHRPLRAAAPGERRARRRQARHPRLDPPQARPARRRRAHRHAAPRRVRPRDPRGLGPRHARDGRLDRPHPSRALGRHRLPARPARRGHPARGPHRRDRRRVRRAHLGPRVPRGAAGPARGDDPRGRPRGALRPAPARLLHGRVRRDRGGPPAHPDEAPAAVA